MYEYESNQLIHLRLSSADQVQSFMAKAQLGATELTPSLCLVATDATLTTNPSVGISANNSPTNHSLCNCFTSYRTSGLEKFFLN